MYDTDKSELDNKIPDTSGPVKQTDYDAKITEIESKIPDVSNLATKTALTTVENKIPDVSSFIKKRFLTLELLRLILRYQILRVKLLKKNEAIESKLKEVTKNLLFIFLEIYSLVDQMVLKLIQYFN